MIRKQLVGTAICAAAIVGFGGSAFAGERAGNGEWTPIQQEENHVGAPAEPKNAECAFSGLQDDEWETLGGPGSVQTPHGEPAFDEFFPPGIASVCQFLNNGNNPKEPPPFPEE